MKIIYTFSFLLVFSLLFVCCKNEQSSHAESKQTWDAQNVKFICTDISKNPEEAPLFVVTIEAAGQKTVVDTIMSCASFTKEDYERHDIPQNAIAACGGWWAGAGDYLYVVEEKGKLVVYAGWQEEQQEDKGFHYKVLKTL